MKKVTGILYITSRCNLRCKMCDLRLNNDGLTSISQLLSPNYEMTPEEWLEVLDRLGINWVHLMGAEPLLYKEFDRLLELISPGRTIALTTNGFLFKKWMASIIEYCDHVYVSLDGYPAIHDAIRGVKGSFAKAWNGLLQVHRHGLKTKVSYAITPENTCDMVSLWEALQKYGIPIVFNHYNFIHPTSAAGYCDPSNLAEYDPKDINIEEVYRAYKMCPTATWSPKLTTLEEMRKYYREIPTELKQPGKGCVVLNAVVAGERFSILADGRMIPSTRCWIALPLGNALYNTMLPSENSDLVDWAERIKKEGFMPPCQRLCCARKVL